MIIQIRSFTPLVQNSILYFWILRLFSYFILFFVSFSRLKQTNKQTETFRFLWLPCLVSNQHHSKFCLLSFLWFLRERSLASFLQIFLISNHCHFNKFHQRPRDFLHPNCFWRAFADHWTVKQYCYTCLLLYLSFVYILFFWKEKT